MKKILLASLKPAIAALQKLLSGLFLINVGRNQEIQKEQKKDLKDAKKSGRLKNHIDNLPSDERDNGLLGNEPANESKPK